MLWWLPLQAAAVVPPDPTLERIQVQAPAVHHWFSTPASMQQRDIDSRTLGFDSAQLLQGLGGLQADARSNLAQDSRMTVRGFGSRSAFGVRGVQLTLDGIPLTTPDGQSQPSTLLLADLASVEVTKGPFAALQGNAGGGLIRLYSLQPTPGQLRVQTQQSHQWQQYQLMLDSDYGQFAANHLTHQGNRPWNTASRSQGLWKHQVAVTDSVVFKWRLELEQAPRLDDPGSLTFSQWQQNPWQTSDASIQFDSHKTTTQQQLAIALTGSDWQLSAWQQQREIKQWLAFSGSAVTSSGGIVDLQRQLTGLDAYQQLHWQALQWQIGVSHQRSVDKRQGFVNQNGHIGALRRDEDGVFASSALLNQWRYQLTNTWQLFAGHRLQHQRIAIDDYFINATNPDDSGQNSAWLHSAALGTQVQWSNQLSWYLSTGKGFESPTLTEMAYQQNAQGPNFSLKPATHQQTETGLKLFVEQQESWWQAQIDLFDIRMRDELVVQSSFAGRTVYQNAPQSQRHGAEVSVMYQHQYWSASYQASLLNTQVNLNSQTVSLPGSAKLNQWAQLEWLCSNHLFPTLALQWQAKSAVTATDDGSVSAPSYQLIHLQASWQDQATDWRWQFTLRASNLTDQRYIGTVIVNQSGGRFFEPGQPRELSAGFNWRFQLL